MTSVKTIDHACTYVQDKKVNKIQIKDELPIDAIASIMLISDYTPYTSFGNYPYVNYTWDEIIGLCIRDNMSVDYDITLTVKDLDTYGIINKRRDTHVNISAITEHFNSYDEPLSSDDDCESVKNACKKVFDAIPSGEELFEYCWTELEIEHLEVIQKILKEGYHSTKTMLDEMYNDFKDFKNYRLNLHCSYNYKIFLKKSYKEIFDLSNLKLEDGYYHLNYDVALSFI